MPRIPSLKPPNRRTSRHFPDIGRTVTIVGTLPERSPSPAMSQRSSLLIPPLKRSNRWDVCWNRDPLRREPENAQEVELKIWPEWDTFFLFLSFSYTCLFQILISSACKYVPWLSKF